MSTEEVPPPADPSRIHGRDEAAVRAIYPRLLARAHRLTRGQSGGDFDAADLVQDGVLAAIRCVHGFADSRLDGLDDAALRAILYAVAAKAIHGRLVDHIRRAEHRRSRSHLVSAPEDADRSFQAGRDARDTLDDMMARAGAPGRRVLAAVAEAGDVDIAEIMARTGYSRPYVYRLLQALTTAGAGA